MTAKETVQAAGDELQDVVSPCRQRWSPWASRVEGGALGQQSDHSFSMIIYGSN
jgi:hypothetical protein